MTAVKSIPFTGAPFPKSEYERRQQKVLETVAQAELDALVVTAHGHLQYLGDTMEWGHISCRFR
ncbi:hypothetical protein [Mesorhizobium sp. M0185]|uniref:hypothetical protein n=1 Tax=Mesorhizobium sp. M0185 TaxID=2956907 RepID=UPI00333A32B2